MQQGNVQPIAAYAPQSNDILRHSDATKAVRSAQRTAEQRNAAKRRYSSAFGCDKRNMQPTAAYALQSHERIRHSAATNAMRGRTHCRAKKFLGIRLRRTQCAAHSGARPAEQRNSWAFGCDEGNAQPAAAHAPHSNESH